MSAATDVEDPDTAPTELTAAVEDMLSQLTHKFSTVSAEMIAKSEHDVDDMSSRLDKLEAIIQQSSNQQSQPDEQ